MYVAPKAQYSLDKSSHSHGIVFIYEPVAFQEFTRNLKF